MALDASQSVAACAVAGTDGLAEVAGPTGAGETTVLRDALASHRWRMLVVAPARRTVWVASREIGAAASSIHALFSDHGYRRGTDEAGAKVWITRRVGDRDRPRRSHDRARCWVDVRG
ncbi:AAA family ATPase [Microbacterium arborescens]|uniref:AAA family ATPase n=1 Tax=Microbacterium arborescens TaxID=33883 RepID=UPI0027D82FED|nr:AAA family ATPase [Microbacterium arborescens]